MRAAQSGGKASSESWLGAEVGRKASSGEDERSGRSAGKRVNQWPRKEFERDHSRERIARKTQEILVHFFCSSVDDRLARLDLRAGKEKLRIEIVKDIFNEIVLPHRDTA